MKKFLAISALIVSSSTMALAQSTPQPTTTDPNTSTTRTDGERHHSWGWLGLIGLVGLAGLRRPKSEFERNMESRGVKVETVR